MLYGGYLDGAIALNWGGNLTMVVCFLSGTMIKMAKGICAVEDLQVGDIVLTFDPKTNTSVTLSNDHGLYLLTENGEEIYQSRVENDKVIFTLPENTQNIYLVSRKSRPCDVIGPFVDDRRSLGVLVGRVAVLNKYGAYPVVRYLQQDELQGWSIVEGSSYRWTMGCAFLPLDVYNAEYSFDIFIQIINVGPYIVQEEQLQEEKKAI